MAVTKSKMLIVGDSEANLDKYLNEYDDKNSRPFCSTTDWVYPKEYIATRGPDN